MTIEVRVPQLPESVADATLVSWHKKPGEAVARDENLVDLETDKVVLEVPAPAAGVLSAIKVTDGTTVTSGQLLALLEESAAATIGAASTSATTGPAAAASTAPAPGLGRAATGGTADAAAGAAAGEGTVKLSPAAKRVAEENKVDAKSLIGLATDGRVSKADVVNFLAAKDAPASTVPPAARVGSAPAAAAAPSVTAPPASARESAVPLAKAPAPVPT
ncbi:MAG TPA: biotin/lipoyl-containing protein, partial [Steroidobacteraceae bacterium]|nr:biotin/lipoyl-containing protein [Steroidobacteraceae bacterium]